MVLYIVHIVAMKFHETGFDDYLSAMKTDDYHKELHSIEDNVPNDKHRMGNLILYGPSGVGKYSRALKIISKYSPSDLKYEKKMHLNSEKYNYSYKISDIHYEIDMSLLGCNAKLVWHELFLQIVDIIAMSSAKFGIILCKNFHQIHHELLPIFYSYMQQYNNPLLPFQIRYILSTEQVSFLHSNIINSVKIVNVKRPSKFAYGSIDSAISPSCILNLKERELLKNIKDVKDIPKDSFDTICESILEQIYDGKQISLLSFRELLYEILIYNLDSSEVFWEIIHSCILDEKLSDDSIHTILDSLYIQLRQYNNNYRPIYHLESILLKILIHIHYQN